MMGFGQVMAGAEYFLVRDGETFVGTGRGRCGDLEAQNSLSGNVRSPVRIDSSRDCC